jgi:hypothetical protein
MSYVIDASKLAWVGVQADGSQQRQYGIVRRYKWNYTDTSKTLAEMEDGISDAGDLDVAEKLHQGDMVKIIGSDGELVTFVYTSDEFPSPLYVRVAWSYIIW